MLSALEIGCAVGEDLKLWMKLIKKKDDINNKFIKNSKYNSK
jgi:hypothetical protein